MHHAPMLESISQTVTQHATCRKVWSEANRLTVHPDQLLYAQGTTTCRVCLTPLLQIGEKVARQTHSVCMYTSLSFQSKQGGYAAMQILSSSKTVCCNRGWMPVVWAATLRCSRSTSWHAHYPHAWLLLASDHLCCDCLKIVHHRH